MKTSFIFFLYLSLCLTGCITKQEQTEEYFILKVNGESKRMPQVGWNGGAFECSISGDTALFIVAGTGESVVFSIKDSKIKDGTYVLNDKNRGFYNYLKGSEYLKHQTTMVQTGSLTIKKSSYPLPAGTLKAMDGTFSFKAIDTVNNKIVTISEGKFMMRRTEY